MIFPRNPPLKKSLLSDMKRGGTVYIITNEHRTVLYTGVTADLARRILEHKEKLNPNSFSAKYNCNKLVYYLNFHHIEEAIAEETRIKGLSRAKKINLIISMNPLWKDLFSHLVD